MFENLTKVRQICDTSATLCRYYDSVSNKQTLTVVGLLSSAYLSLQRTATEGVVVLFLNLMLQDSFLLSFPPTIR